jgi:cytochrome P450
MSCIDNCLGAHLARLAARVVREEVVKRFSAWEVDCDNVVQGRSLIVCGLGKLPVTAAPRPAPLGWA